MEPNNDAEDRVAPTMAPYFPEYDVRTLDLQSDAAVIIERTLEYGAWSDVRWLVARFGTARIRQAIQERGARHLTPRAFAYWRIVFDVDTWRVHPWPDVAAALWCQRG